MDRSGDSKLFRELFDRAVSLHLLDFLRCVLVQKLIDRKVAATYPHVDLVLVHANEDSATAEHVHILFLAHKHDFELLPVRVVIHVLCKPLIYQVILDRNVDRDAGLEVQAVLLECLDFDLCLLKPLQQLERFLISCIHFVLKFAHVLGSSVQIVLELAFLSLLVQH